MNATKERACQPPALANNEQGFVLVMALMILVVLSIMGTAAMTVRNTEVMIATNAEIIQHNFYALEAVTLEGTTRFAEADDSDFSKFLVKVLNGEVPVNDPEWDDAKWTWFRPNDPDNPPADIIDLSQRSTWTSTKITPNETGLKTSGFDIRPAGYVTPPDHIHYAAVQGNLNSDSNEYDICAGSDLSDSTKREACFSVFGMYEVNSGAGKAYSGRRMLMVGYKKTIYLNP